MDLPGYRPRTEGNLRQIRLAAEAINRAERPIIYAGGGVISSGGSDELRELARKCHIPVTTTLMALGAGSSLILRMFLLKGLLLGLAGGVGGFVLGTLLAVTVTEPPTDWSPVADVFG